MKFLSRVVWSEGMHLGPHHFQTQSRYFEDTLWFFHANSRQNPWGFLHYSLDQGMIRNGQALLTVASGIMPDGLIFDLPGCDSVPPPVSLSSLFTPSDSSVTLYLVIPSRHDQGLDCDTTGSSSTRYGSVVRTLRDDTLGQDEYPVSFGHKNLALFSEAQLPAGTASFAVARILRDTNGGYVSDPAFIPPCLRIGASEPLVLLLRRLLDALEEKAGSVRRDRRGASGLELGTSALDVGNYWFLHCLSSAMPALRQHVLTRLSHPQDVYLDLARLAGALSTFSVEAPDEVPPYAHDDLTATFGNMDRLIRRYLNIVAPTEALKLEFTRRDTYVYTAPIKDERCLRRSKWVLGIRSSIGDSTLLRQVPRLVKICSAGGVKTLIERALPGFELLHLPVPPSTMSAQADMHYFSISLNGPCWEHVLKTKEVGVFLPVELGTASFDLTVIPEMKA